MKVDKPRDYLRDVFSISKLNTFSKCPRMFFLQYVARQRPAPTEALLIGRGAHAGMEWDNEERVKGRKPPIGEVLDRAAVAYQEEGGGDVDRFVEEHEQQLAVYDRDFRHRFAPVKGTIEMPFEVTLNICADPDREAPEPATIQGFVDVVAEVDAEGRQVVDYKTGARPVSETEAGKSDQLTLYCLGSELEQARIVNFVRYAKQKPTTKITPPIVATQARVEKLLTFCHDTISEIRRCLKSGSFPKCGPACFWCSPTACSFYEQCYGHNPQLSRFVSIADVKPVGTIEQPEWRKR